MTLICNCRRQDTSVPWGGHEPHCDIGYGPQLTGWHVEQGHNGMDSECYVSDCGHLAHVDREEPHEL